MWLSINAQLAQLPQIFQQGWKNLQAFIYKARRGAVLHYSNKYININKLVVVEVLLNVLQRISLQPLVFEKAGKEEYSRRINKHGGVIFQTIQKLEKYANYNAIPRYTQLHQANNIRDSPD